MLCIRNLSYTHAYYICMWYVCPFLIVDTSSFHPHKVDTEEEINSLEYKAERILSESSAAAKIKS